MIGKTISHYKILEELGRGGMGIVYKAHDLKLDRYVALKFLSTSYTSDAEAKERFIHEAKAASALQHHNIFTIHEIDETDDGQMFICMDFYEGETLKDKIARGPLELEEALDIEMQVAQGLAKAHEKNIIHRDIKSANIMITEDGIVKILDFGLAKLKGQSKLTKTGATMGTVAYMSPEQATGGEVDQRTDLWSLGVILYEMITNQLPFQGEYEQAVIYSLMNKEQESLTNLRKDIPLELERITDTALAKNPEERYQQAGQLLADMKKVRRSLGEFDKIRSPKILQKKVRKKLLSYIAKMAATMLLLLIGFFLIKTQLFKQAFVGEPKTVAVIGFENQTGEERYDYLCKVIPNLLIINLEQSRYLRVMTWERMYDLLRQMGKEDLEIIDIDKEIGFEICRIEGVDAIVVGSFAKAGDMFASEAKVLDIESKTILTSVKSMGKEVGSILKKQIDELSKGISRGVGLSERKIESMQISIADATTTSLEAYNYFLRGRTDYERFYSDDARSFLERAVELDSTFAVAYLYLAFSYGALGRTSERNNAYEKAMFYAQKATKKERLYIEANYASDIERDSEKQYSILKQMALQFPREKRVHMDLAFYFDDKRMLEETLRECKKVLELDPKFGWAINLLSYTYADLGNHALAMENFQKYARISPGDANPFDSMAELYFRMGELDESIIKYKEAIEVREEYYDAYWRVAYVYALKEDYAKAMHWIDIFIGMAPTSGIAVQGYWWKGLYLYWEGDIDSCLRHLHQAEELAKDAGNEYWRSRVDWLYSWVYYDKGEFELGREHYKRRFEFFERANTERLLLYSAEYTVYLGLANLKQGQIDSAEINLTRIKSLIPLADTNFKNWLTFYRDLLSAEILLAKGFLKESIAVSSKESTLEILNILSSNRVRYQTPYPKDVLARAYAQNGQLYEAITEYQRLISFDPNENKRCLIHPKYYYRLAKLYEEKSWISDAIEKYEKFLKIWKDADEDSPELIDAKQRLAQLSG